jgi:hypothetical protein
MQQGMDAVRPHPARMTGELRDTLLPVTPHESFASCACSPIAAVPDPLVPHAR